MDFTLPQHYEAFDLSQDFCLVLDREGSIHFANRALREAIAWPTSWDLPLSVVYYVEAPVREAWVAFLESEVKESSFCLPLSSATGEVVPVRWMLHPYGEGIIAIGHPDQNVLNEQALVNAYEHMAFLLDAAGKLVAFNEPASHNMALVSEQPLAEGALFVDYIPEKDRDYYRELVEAGLSGEKITLNHELTFHEKSRWLDITVGPIEDSQERVGRVLLVVQDITKRKQEEERFKELEVSFKSVFRQLAAGVLFYDLELRLLQANQGVTDILGYTPQEVEALGSFGFTYPEDEEMSRTMAEKLIHGELDRYSVEKRYVHKNGQVLWCMLTATLVYDVSGRPKNIISVIQDLSKQKRIEEDLRFKKNELDAFVYRASHDLKGPVQSLLGLHQVIEMEIEDAKSLEYFGHYHKNIQRLHDIIANLLELSRIKDIRANFRVVEVEKLVDDAKDALRHLPNFDQITFQQEFDLPPKIKSDPTLLGTIIQNLIENAIKYSKSYAPGDVHIRMRYQDDMLILQVQDSGIGIKQEVLPKIFNMFYRATEQATGSGLGLYLLKNAVDKLEGTIDIDTEYGEGTTFTIFLPTPNTD